MVMATQTIDLHHHCGAGIDVFDLHGGCNIDLAIPALKPDWYEKQEQKQESTRQKIKNNKQLNKQQQQQEQEDTYGTTITNKKKLQRVRKTQ